MIFYIQLHDYVLIIHLAKPYQSRLGRFILRFRRKHTYKSLTSNTLSINMKTIRLFQNINTKNLLHLQWLSESIHQLCATLR